MVLKQNGILSLESKILKKIEKNECQIKVGYVGICSTDINRAFCNGAYNYPLIMGHEISGRIVSVGSAVNSFKIGQKVAVFPLLPCNECESCFNYEYAQCTNYSYYGSRKDGGYCEYMNVNEWNLLSIPDEVDLKDAALIEPLAVVVHALRKCGFLDRPNITSSILIFGGGFLGQLAVKLLKHLNPNSNITVCDRNEEKLEVIKSSNQNVECVNQADIKDKKYNSRYEYVIECAGKSESFIRSIILVKHGGTLIWMGNIDENLLLEKDMVSSILRKEIKIFGTWNSNYKHPKFDDWEYSIKLILKGFYPSELLTSCVNIENLPIVLNKMFDHKSKAIKFNFTKYMFAND